MRKLLLLAVAASTLAVVGTAAAVKPGVSITASKSTVVYGGTVKLSGVVASHQAGTEVRVLERAYGATTFSQVASVNTTTGGEWSYTASPAILSRYEAQVGGNATSRVVTVKVRPKIVLALQSRTARRGTFMVTVNGARSFTGKYVLIQRLTSSGPVNLKHVKLGASSSATFTIRLPQRRARVRAVMPSSQAAPGYIAGYSNVWKSS